MKHKATIVLAAILLASGAAMAQTAPHATPPESFKFLSAREVNALTDLPTPGAHTAFVGDHETHFVEYALRNAQGNVPEMHAHWTHYIHVLSGEATLTYGGTVSNARETGPGQVRGDAIVGGVSIAMHAGDYVQIPAGMPHLFNVPAGMKFYYLVFNTRE